jgi:mitogen-activated protein kinase kinase kinase 4
MLQVESLLLVVIHSSQLGNQRKEFEALMGNTVELVNEQTSCHQVIAESLIELKVWYILQYVFIHVINC